MISVVYIFILHAYYNINYISKLIFLTIDPSPPSSQTHVSAAAKTRPGSHVQVQVGRAAHTGHTNYRGSIAGDQTIHFDDHVFYDEEGKDTSEGKY